LGRQKSTITESLVVHGSSSSTVIARVQAAFEPMPDYVLTAPSDDVLQVARSAGRRSRRTEFCTIRAIQEPQRLVVTLSGHLGPNAMDAVRAAVHGIGSEPVSGPEVESFQASQQPSTSSFMPPTDWFVTADTQLASPPPPTPQPPAGDLLPPPTAAPVASEKAHDTVLRSSGGPRMVQREALIRVGNGPEQPLSGILLIGRAPQPRPVDPTNTQTLQVADAAMSKTHLALGRTGDDIWLEDRNSSNGTQWNDQSGRERSATPDVRVVVDLPCRISAGDTVISIGWSV
jgi:hypothetical protein